MCVLPQVRFVSASNSEWPILWNCAKHQQGAVFDLFHGIRHAIGTVHLHRTR